MNELFEIYKRIEYLRNNGVKMKEIADHTQMAASVLSSLYSSVLPTFIGEVKKGIAEEEALDYALSQVNNVSKKRLLGNLEDMKERLFELEPPQGGEKRKSPFWDMMARRIVLNILGTSTPLSSRGSGSKPPICIPKYCRSISSRVMFSIVSSSRLRIT